MVRKAGGPSVSTKVLILLFLCVTLVRATAFFGTRTRQDVMGDALANICRTHVHHSIASVLQHVAQYL